VQCHWWDYAVPGLDLLAERLLRARDAGKVRLIGATNFDTEHLRYLIDGGLPLISVQAQYSLLDRRPERRMAALARDTGVQLLAYGALAGGFLGDAWLGREAPTEMNRSQAKYRLIIDEAGGWAACQGLLAGLAGIGARHGVSAAQVAVRWVLEQSMSAAVILGVGRHPRVTEHLGLFGWRLDASDQQDIGRLLGDLSIPAGDMYELERRGDSPHASLIRTDLQDVIA
jgi:aryl-alcohol dehydrogenase-like predicted oxidoreductase